MMNLLITGSIVPLILEAICNCRNPGLDQSCALGIFATIDTCQGNFG
ncbi:hypothetical protein KC19_4G115900 [Ceratodon purpureus]|uniref:Uncharacterized protein n=1 Tax=Ceratodon purpureus TaxID=3225 RepID=A0A8T0I9I5_CERPU|nr:hypothetical protein KC19_4G115900 [Ceratodon purpureus]